MIESPRDRDDSHFQHHEEVPLEIKMADLGEKHGDKETEDIIKEKKA